MPSEIERKFLIPTVPDWLGDHPATRIEQGYLAIDAEAEVRLRRAGGELTMTVKRGSGEVREEVEIFLGPGQFSRLWALTEGRRLTKTRHVVPLGDRLRAEVDVYAGSLGRAGHGRGRVRDAGAQPLLPRAQVDGRGGDRRPPATRTRTSPHSETRDMDLPRTGTIKT